MHEPERDKSWSAIPRPRVFPLVSGARYAEAYSDGCTAAGLRGLSLAPTHGSGLAAGCRRLATTGHDRPSAVALTFAAQAFYGLTLKLASEATNGSTGHSCACCASSFIALGAA